MLKLSCKTCVAFLILAGALVACSPQVGSPEWCAKMKEKPKGDWTSNEASEFAKSCLF
ncbi:MAG: DUF3012 domain-containing protein [Rhodospirillales bacterium]|nr:DUF3012 domain-containing protein [Rhodospirillales bacterium]